MSYDDEMIIACRTEPDVGKSNHTFLFLWPSGSPTQSMSTVLFKVYQLSVLRQKVYFYHNSATTKLMR